VAELWDVDLDVPDEIRPNGHLGAHVAEERHRAVDKPLVLEELTGRAKHTSEASALPTSTRAGRRDRGATKNELAPQSTTRKVTISIVPSTVPVIFPAATVVHRGEPREPEHSQEHEDCDGNGSVGWAYRSDGLPSGHERFVL
jgi:hypothetical protein